MHLQIPADRSRRLLLLPAIALLLTACGGPKASPLAAAVATPAVSPDARTTPGASDSASSPAESPTDTPTPVSTPSDTAPPDTGGGTTSGDVPDNAVFLTYKGSNPNFRIQYVEGWQVGRQADGVVIRDKDSSETVTIQAPQTDVKGYVASTDLPALQTRRGFKLEKQDTVKVGSTPLVHLVFHMPSPPDPVTGKQVPSTIDRYYVPGPAGLAIVSLSTPDGVDNVDAFRQMIESFKWS